MRHRPSLFSGDWLSTSRSPLQAGTFRRFAVLAATLALVVWSASCSSPDGDDPSDSDATADTGPTDAAGIDADATAPDADGTPGVDARLVHQFPDYTLEPGEEVWPECVQWTIGNEEPIYVNSVTLANGGGFHHSNWMIVPEDYVPGDDGFFDCEERGFREINAATQGTVLFAQSTQAERETQKFPAGSVVKIPPGYKIVANVHFLNIRTRALETFARMTLGLTHPKDVDVVLAPFRLTYYDLEIPPESEARFTGECNLADIYESATDGEFDMELYYALPHFHELGNYFNLELLGGPRDGEQLLELQGFDAEANGKVFDPPVDLSGSDGFRFTCGYDNPRDEEVTWGIGGDEMCVMLGFADSQLMMDASVQSGSEDGTEDGIIYESGSCGVLPIDKNEDQDMPTEEEIEGEMYVPPGTSDADVDPLPECEDAPDDVEPFRSPTLTNIYRDIFSVSCTFSACHGADAPSAGLDLETEEGLHDRLMNHDVQSATDLPLVDPGNPDGSWLHVRTSECEPEIEGGTVSHMPRNSPTLLDSEVVAMIREWIALGAESN